MNWSAIDAISQLVGAAAVIVSLLYVAAQVKASTRQARHDAGRDLAARVSDVSLTVASDPELGKLLVAGGADMESLAPGDQARFRALMNGLFRGFEQQYLLHREGALDEETWAAVERMTRDWVALPGVQTYFRDRGGWYTDSFLAHVNQLAGGHLVMDGGKSLHDHYGEAVSKQTHP